MKRREFLTATAGGLLVAAESLSANQAMAALPGPEIKAIAFDAFPVFDPRPIFGLVGQTFSNHADFGKMWFNKIFAYTWLRTSGDRYQDFLSVIAEALDYTVAAHGETLTEDQRQELLDVWFTLRPWPDVADAIEQFDKQNIRLAFLYNFTEEMLRANARNGGLENKFDYLSTDNAGAFKPDPKAYSLGLSHFGLPKDNIAFCAFAAWDAAGASWFGYPTVWVNRLGQAPERLNQGEITEGNSMSALRAFVA